jgi:glycosyltransferase involved in cell wall biosynthesis
MNAVWLASWYPNRTSITNGDFIERHAKAVAPFLTSLTVIAVVKDESLALNATELIEKKEGNLTTYIVYYGRSRWGGLVEKFLSVKKYIALHLDLFDRVIKEKGAPGIVHVHVAMKAGMVARKIKQLYRIPYIVTEHSSMYFKEAIPNIYTAGSFINSQTKGVFKNASLLLTVSNELAMAINKNFVKVNCRVVPNVVDTRLFYPGNASQEGPVRLIHVSGMGHPKNMEAIIEALAIYKSRGNQFLMQVYGTAPDAIIQKVKAFALDANIFFHGEVMQPEIAAAMREADVLILYSKYETFGCVVIEANACGKPVIVSDIPVFHELVTEDKNGLFGNGNDPAALAVILESFAEKRKVFDQATIAAEAASHYSYAVVGRQIKDIYEELLKTQVAG